MMKRRRDLHRKRNSNRKLIACITIIIFIAQAAYGIYFAYVQGILLNDAFSRTANAFYVVFVKPPRYSSIGLVWNPLPSTLQLPFMFLAKFWRPIASKGIAAAINTAIFSALTAGVLLNTFFKLNVSKKYSLLAVALYALNPFIFFYGSNGMSEVVAFFFMICSVCCLVLWMRSGAARYMIELGFALSALFLTRYEAIPFAAAVGISVILHTLFSREERKYIADYSEKEHYYYIEGTLILIFTPFVYTIFLWILFNLVITGNPLYFLNSVYSNVSQSVFAEIKGNYFQILLYALKRALPFLPLFFSILLTRIVRKKLTKHDFISLAMLVAVMIIFHYLMLIKGTSFGWLRFFAYSLPICIAWIPYEISECEPKFLNFAKTAMIVGLVLSSFLCFRALNDKDLAKEEKFVHVSSEAYAVADYINANIPDQKILMDVFTLSGVMLNVNNTDNLVVSSSLNFNACVKDPLHNGINYIVVPNPEGVGNLDAINMRYKDLYKNGADWCKEEAVFDDIKLFKVID